MSTCLLTQYFQRYRSCQRFAEVCRGYPGFAKDSCRQQSDAVFHWAPCHLDSLPRPCLRLTEALVQLDLWPHRGVVLLVLDHFLTVFRAGATATIFFEQLTGGCPCSHRGSGSSFSRASATLIDRPDICPAPAYIRDSQTFHKYCGSSMQHP